MNIVAAKGIIKVWAEAYDNGEWDGDTTPEQYLAEYSNQRDCTVDRDGSLHVGDPSTPHYVDDDSVIRFAGWLVDRKLVYGSYRVTATHTNGASVTHACRFGVYSDVVDSYDEIIEANSDEDAEVLGYEQLFERAKRDRVCDCDRKLRPGVDRWAESVTVTAEPL